MANKIEAHHIYRAIAEGADGREYACFSEVRSQTGYGKEDRRIDIWRINLWPSKQVAQSFESKISRADFLNEIRNPDKRQFALSVSNQFYFICPPGVVRDELEIPEECGWMECIYDARQDRVVDTKIRKLAPMRALGQASWSFLMSVARKSNEYSSQVFDSLIRSKMRDLSMSLYDDKWKTLDRIKELALDMHEQGHPEIYEKIKACFVHQDYFPKPSKAVAEIPQEPQQESML